MKRRLTITVWSILVVHLTIGQLCAQHPPIAPQSPSPTLRSPLPKKPLPPWSSILPLAHVLFVSNQNSASFGLYSMAVDGTDLKQIPGWQSTDNWPSFSPDGRSIVFASRRTGSWHLYAMNADGTHVHQLTAGPNQELEPVYSPAGGVLAFTCVGNGWQDICLAGPDGTSMVKLTDGRGQYSSPAFSPNGQAITFVGRPWVAPSVNPCSCRFILTDIYLIRLSSRTMSLVPIRLTDGSAARYAPSFTPDSQHIVYAQAAYNDVPNLYVMNLDGSGQTALPLDPFPPNDEPIVRGNRLLFVNQANGGWDVYSANLDGTEAQDLTSGQGRYGTEHLRYLDVFSYGYH